MKIPAVILAAGASRRLGYPKQLVEVDGECMIHRTARFALTVCEPVWVVTGFESEKIQETLRDLPVKCLKNLDWEEGMASSLRAAVTALPLEARAALFLVCDQPAVDQALLEKLIAAHHQHPDRRIASRYAEIRGIPAVLPRRDFDALVQLRGDRGAQFLLRDPEVFEVPFPGGELDLDRPEDVRKLEIR